MVNLLHAKSKTKLCHYLLLTLSSPAWWSSQCLQLCSPLTGTQPVHVATKQAIAHCSHTPSNCSVSQKSQWLCWQPRAKSRHFKMVGAESGKCLLRELQHTTSKQKKLCQSLFVCVQNSFSSFLRFYVDFSWPHGCQFVEGRVTCLSWLPSHDITTQKTILFAILFGQ